MRWDRIDDFSDAYENRAYIPDFEDLARALTEEAAAFRATMEAAGRARLGIAYGADARQVLDLFLPEGAPKGLVVFVHGGYWRSFHGSDYSHMAAGALAHGHAVAVPSYRLAPNVRLAEIGRDVAAAIACAADEVAGPVRLVGHSAGGHLVARMACADRPLPEAVSARVAHVLPVSGVFDLRPLMRTDKNADLRLDGPEAAAESPALLDPLPDARLTVWVGADERPEFVRQSVLIANVWLGAGAATRLAIEPARHHFDVIDALVEPSSALVRTLLD